MVHERSMDKVMKNAVSVAELISEHTVTMNPIGGLPQHLEEKKVNGRDPLSDGNADCTDIAIRGHYHNSMVGSAQYGKQKGTVKYGGEKCNGKEWNGYNALMTGRIGGGTTGGMNQIWEMKKLQKVVSGIETSMVKVYYLGECESAYRSNENDTVVVSPSKIKVNGENDTMRKGNDVETGRSECGSEVTVTEELLLGEFDVSEFYADDVIDVVKEQTTFKGVILCVPSGYNPESVIHREKLTHAFVNAEINGVKYPEVKLTSLPA